MSNDIITFGEYLRTLRLERKLSGAKAARMLGFKPQKLHDMESGRRYTKRISLELAAKLSKVYNVPIADILKNTEAAVTTEKTVSEILAEVWPHARLAELSSKVFMEECKRYSPEMEQRAIEVHESTKSIRALLSLLKKRYFQTSESEKESGP